jgi:hypothetical protein
MEVLMANVKTKPRGLLLAGVLLGVAALPAMPFALSIGQDVGQTQAVDRADACRADLKTLSAKHKGTFTADTLSIPSGNTIAPALAELQQSLLYCGDFGIRSFCAGSGCPVPGVTLALAPVGGRS